MPHECRGERQHGEVTQLDQLGLARVQRREFLQRVAHVQTTCPA